MCSMRNPYYKAEMELLYAYRAQNANVHMGNSDPHLAKHRKEKSP